MAMQSNIGKIDAGIRYTLGFVLLAVLLLVEGPWRWIGLLGFVLIGTAVINFCPVWRLFGISTSKQSGGSRQEPSSRAL